MKALKIGIVCYPSLGGSGVVATELGHALASRGHEVHFITYELPFRLRLSDKNIFFHEVEINQYDLFKYPDYALTLAVKIAAVSSEFDLDILHVHYAIPHATSAFLAKRILEQNKPSVITTLHGTDITLVGLDAAYYRIVKFSIEESCGVTAVSHALKKQTEESFHIEKPIEVIYNFFTPRPELLRQKPMRHLFVRNHEKLLIHASNYRSVKRPQDLIKIFAQVRKEVDSKLLLLGSGSGLEEARKVIHELHLEDHVFFEGNNVDIDPYLASGDLFLLPSEQESFGLAALEAMSYGVPAIATDVGGLPELITSGKTGYLSSLGDIEGMAKNAITLLNNPDLYQQMSEAVRKEACERFCSEKIIPQYEAFYLKVLGESGE